MWGFVVKSVIKYRQEIQFSSYRSLWSISRSSQIKVWESKGEIIYNSHFSKKSAILLNNSATIGVMLLLTWVTPQNWRPLPLFWCQNLMYDGYPKMCSKLFTHKKLPSKVFSLIALSVYNAQIRFLYLKSCTKASVNRFPNGIFFTVKFDLKRQELHLNDGVL